MEQKNDVQVTLVRLLISFIMIAAGFLFTLCQFEDIALSAIGMLLFISGGAILISTDNKIDALKEYFDI